MSDRKEAALVSKTWLEASCDPILLHNVVSVYNGNESTPSIRKYGWVAPSVHWENCRLCITKSLIQSEAYVEMCKRITKLSLSGNEIMVHSFTVLLAQCQNLRILDLTGCNNLFIAGQILSKETEKALVKPVLQNIRELYLSSIRHLTDMSLNNFLLLCSNVEKLSLSGNQIMFYSHEYFMDYSSNCNVAVLTFRNILTNIALLAQSLVSLDFSRTQLDSKALGELAIVYGLSLKELVLSGCRELTDVGIKNFCLKQTKLKHLDLSGCVNIGDTALIAVTESLESLQWLNINKCNKVSQYSITKLHKLQKLQKLDMTGCYRFSSNELMTGILGESLLSNLTSITVSCSETVDDDFIYLLCHKLPNIEHLDISSCFKISDISILFISGMLHRLRYLSLAWCKEITDNGLAGTSIDAVQDAYWKKKENACKCTRKSSILHQCQKTEKECSADNKNHHHSHCYINFTEIPAKPISNLERLESLNLSACHKISDKSVATVFKFNSLKVLNLNLCTAITDCSLKEISWKIPSLQELYIGSNCHITDSGINIIAVKLKRLQQLDISNCDFLTNKTLESLKACAKSLKYLNVSMCKQITLSTLEAFEESMPHLILVQKRLVGEDI